MKRVLLAGVSSDDVEVLSDVRSVIGPGLCLIYINSLSESLTSNVRWFAHDTIAYLSIHSELDSDNVQYDLEKLSQKLESYR